MKFVKSMLSIQGINDMNVDRHRLHLLAVLDALLCEGSVTGAARKLHLSQPATSAALSQLRDWVGDPLLVRVKGGYALTMRALDLKEPVRKILVDIDRELFVARAFDPATAHRTFVLGCNEAFAYHVLPSVIHGLRRIAPGVSLKVIDCGPVVPIAQLERGELHMCVGHFSEQPSGLHSLCLFTERMVCISRLNHPVVRKTPTLKQFAQVGHVVVSPQGAPFLVQAQNTLKNAGLEPRIVLELPHVLAVGPVVARSDLFATLPEKLARRIAGPMRLKIFESPLAFSDFKVSAIWHDRVHLDSGCSWFREFLSGVCDA